jgi:hypothetical protein
MLHIDNQRNHARHLVGLALALAGVMSPLGLTGYSAGSSVLSASTITAARSTQGRTKASSSAFAQNSPQSLNTWSSNGPEGGAILSLAIDPINTAIIYAGTRVGVYKSSNGGASWSRTALTRVVLALVMDGRNPNIIYAGTYGSGVFKSTDGGVSWSAINKGLTSAVVNALAIDPLNPCPYQKHHPACIH